MAIVPGLKQTEKPFLIHSSQIGSDPSQVNRGLQFRIAGEVSGQDGLLMEVAHLLMDPLKEPEQSRLSVRYDRLNLKAKIFDLFPDQTVFMYAFGLNEPIGNHRLAPGIFRNQDSEFISAFAEERGIENQGDIPWFFINNRGLIGMNFPLNPDSGSLIFSREFLESAAVVEILFE